MNAHPEPFRERRHAGRQLADRLAGYADRHDVIVLGLPRGGVPVAFEVSQALHAPLDVFVVRKLGVPGHEEFAMGAIASGGVRVLDMSVASGLGVSQTAIYGIEHAERRELERREATYRAGRAPLKLAGSTVLVVDDGLATGATMRVAVKALRLQNPAQVVVAVPVGSSEAVARLQRDADAVICVAVPEPFRSVGQWYADFSQTSDDEVLELLQQDRKVHDETLVPQR